MKEFDLEKAKAGAPVCLRDGRKAKIICFDANNDHPIVVLVKSVWGKHEEVHSYMLDGHYNASIEECRLDLMMDSDKKVLWTNVYRITKSDGSKDIELGGVFKTEEQAKLGSNVYPFNYTATAKIEWEE